MLGRGSGCAQPPLRTCWRFAAPSRTYASAVHDQCRSAMARANTRKLAALARTRTGQRAVAPTDPRAAYSAVARDRRQAEGSAPVLSPRMHFYTGARRITQPWAAVRTVVDQTPAASGNDSLGTTTQLALHSPQVRTRTGPIWRARAADPAGALTSVPPYLAAFETLLAHATAHNCL